MFKIPQIQQCVLTSSGHYGPWDRIPRDFGEPRPHEPEDAEVFAFDSEIPFYIRPFEPCDELQGWVRAERIGMYLVTIVFRNGVRIPCNYPQPLPTKKSYKAPWLKALEEALRAHKSFPGAVPEVSSAPRYLINDQILAMR